jgi:hypothetical protein
MAKKKAKPPGTEQRFCALPDGRVMKDPGLTEEWTGEGHLELLGKGWTINIPPTSKKKVKFFVVSESPPDDYYLLGPSVGRAGSRSLPRACWSTSILAHGERTWIID